MKTLKSIFALSAMTLAVQAQASDCDSLGSATDMSYWENPGVLVSCILGEEAPQSGPETGGPEFQINTNNSNDTVGREDSDAFDPDVVTSNLHIKLPDVAEGELVGYTANFQYSYYENEEDEESYSETFSPNGVGSIVLNLVDDPEGQGDTIGVEMFDQSGNTLYSKSFYNGDNDEFESNNANYQPADSNEEGGHLSGYHDIYNEGSNTYSEEGIYAYSLTSSEDEDFELLKDFWSGYLYDISSTYEEEIAQDQGTLSTLAFGVRTPLSDLQTLIANNVSASYSGFSSYYGQMLELAVNFGNKSFTADVNDGDYGPRIIDDSPDVDTSFTATGTIDGTELISNSITAQDTDNISGILQGSFVGTDASGIIGAYDITKEGNRINDTFHAIEDSLIDMPY